MDDPALLLSEALPGLFVTSSGGSAAEVEPALDDPSEQNGCATTTGRTSPRARGGALVPSASPRLGLALPPMILTETSSRRRLLPASDLKGKRQRTAGPGETEIPPVVLMQRAEDESAESRAGNNPTHRHHCAVHPEIAPVDFDGDHYLRREWRQWRDPLPTTGGLLGEGMRLLPSACFIGGLSGGSESAASANNKPRIQVTSATL